jgi:fructose-bisphosphate aldolase, class II
MTLTSIGNHLRQARKEQFAIPLFDAFDSISAEGIFQAFEERHVPGIIAIYSPMINQPQGMALAAFIKERAQNSSTPISLMLDHGSSVEHCIRAIQLGFSDVMIDGSSLSLEENIAQTRIVVRAAHACGLCAEAELGHVGQGSHYQEEGAQRIGFTDPAQVEHFVQETEADFLAVAIGSAHGLYQGEPHLDLSLLDEIRSKIEIPLVLHGGTGISENQFHEAIRRGVAKVNVATDLFIKAGKCIAEACQGGESMYFKLNEVAINAFRERCIYYIDLFRGAVVSN